MFICTDILAQWEKLHAFAKERQSESSELSMMNKCLEEMEAELSSCDEGIKAFKSLRDVEHNLISTKVTCVANDLTELQIHVPCTCIKVHLLTQFKEILLIS